MLAQGVEDFESTLAHAQPGVVAIVEDNFNFLTKMCTLRMREAALHMIRCAAQRGCRVLVNGSDAADHAGTLPGSRRSRGCARGAGSHGARAARCLGDRRVGHHTHRWACAAARSARCGPHQTSPRGAGAGRAAHTCLGLHRCRELPQRMASAHGHFSINLAASRGCPYGCNWCAKPLFGRAYMQRSPRIVARSSPGSSDTSARTTSGLPTTSSDSRPQWLEDVRERSGRAWCATPFTIQSRVNLMTPSVLSRRCGAGVEEVWLGVESGSQRVLDAMEKGSRVEQVRKATRRSRPPASAPAGSSSSATWMKSGMTSCSRAI